MNKAVYEQNMEVLEKKYPAWKIIIESIKRKKRNFDVIAEKSLTDETILKVKQDGKTLYLNGKYAPSAVVDKWINEQGKIEEFATILIIGISNGMHIRRIMESVPRTVNILVYEPSLEVFRRALEEIDLSFLFQLDIPVGIIVEGLNRAESTDYLNHFITYDNMALLKFYISGNYIELFEENVGEFIGEVRKRTEAIRVGWNTTIRYTSINAKNVFRNLPYLYEGYATNDLQGILPEDVPVIVVSAGPSLNKNIMDLKKAQGKACIIATDTAMKPLLNAGIVPNLFVIVDGLKPAKLFQHKDISKVPMVTMTAVSVEPMKLHKGKKFFYHSNSSLEDKILQEVGEQAGINRILYNIPTGGSVANTAYSLGVHMGARTVILVGQDLALTGNRTHADGTFQDKMDEIDTNDSEYFEVESVDGGKVLTRSDFKLYLDWFEDYIKMWSHITTIDATEGGALIHGSKKMTLKKAISKYCIRDFNVKWHIDHTRKLFNKEEKKIALDYFLNSEKKLLEVKKKAKEGLGYYEKLSKLAKKPSVSDNELKKVLKKIKKINKYMEQDYMAETVTESLKGVEYTLRPLIYQVQEDKNNELADVAAQGSVMLQAIEIAAEEIRELALETVIPYAQKQQTEENV